MAIGSSLARTAPRAAATTRSARSRASLRTVVPPAIVFVVLVGLFYLASLYYDKVKGLPFLVPYPHLILKALFAEPLFTPQLLTALGNTALASVTGLAIAIVIGVVWAVLMVQARWVESSLFPYAVILQCIPILALVPLIGSLFGYDFPSRVIVTVLIALFPMVSNTLFGLQSVDRGQMELFQLQGAGRLTTLVKLRFPAALPAIFIGLRTAAGLSVIGAIVGDQFFQRGPGGLGVLIQVESQRVNGAEMFAAILVASAFGVAVFLFFGFLARFAIGKWFDFN